MNTCAKCGAEHSRFRDVEHTRPSAYCHGCHAAHMSRTRPKHSELPEDARQKANARSYARMYRKRGKIAPAACEACGKEQAEMHHPDYSSPIDVRWLCRGCHLATHRQHVEHHENGDGQ